MRDDLPEPAGEAVLDVLCAGICGTDLQLLQGYAGFEGIPGHEFVGLHEGRRVVSEINCPCGSCALCVKGLGNHCAARQVLGIRGRPGCFAERIAVPLANLHEVPASLSDEEAVFVEPLAAAIRIVEQLSPAPGTRALVLGDGRLGLLVAQVLEGVTVLSRRPSKQTVLTELGLPFVACDQELPTDHYDLVVECTGVPAMLDRALDVVRPCGTVVLKSSWNEPSAFQAARIMVKEVRLQGSRCGPFAPALRALATGAVRVKPLITDRFSLSEGPAAFARAAEPGVLKVLVDVHHSAKSR